MSAEISPQAGDYRAFDPRDLSSRKGSGGSNTVGIKIETPIDSCDDWFEHCLERTRENVELRLPETGRERVNVISLEIARSLLLCQLGDRVLARFPLQVARLAGHALQVPDEESSYNPMFAQLLTAELDAIYLDSVKPETFLWHYLQSSPLIQKSFRFYSQQGPQPHWLIRLNGSFSNYMKRLSPKTRKNRLREIKILQKLGDVKLIRVTEAFEIDAFLKVAYGISQKTWQFKRFGWSIAARDPSLVKNQLLRLAQRGWLRSYLLTCGNLPCSFILGEQRGSRFRPVAAGADPAWRDYGVGTILLLYALEDLFKENSPDFYDLGTSAKHKEYLATDSYLEASAWLFCRQPYATLASSTYRMCSLTSRIGGAALERLRLKRIVTRLMQGMDLVVGGTAIGPYSNTLK